MRCARPRRLPKPGLHRRRHKGPAAGVDREVGGDAEARGRDEIARLEKERGSLESRINELRQFERDYRSQLRSYFEGKLRDLDSTSSGSDQTPVSAIGQ